MFAETSDLIQALEQDGAGIHADVFKLINAAYPYGVRLWDEDTGNTLDVRLCKSLDDAIYSARGAMCSQRAKRASRGNEGRYEGAETTAPDPATEATWRRPQH